MSVGLLLLAICSHAAAQGILYKGEGEVCKEESPPWYCRVHTDCPGSYQAIKQGKFPKICSFKQRNVPIICCQPSFEASSTTTTEKTPNNPYWNPNWPSWTRPQPKPTVTDKPSWTTQSTNLVSSPLKESKAEEKCRAYEKYVYKEVPSLVPLPGSKPNRISYCGRVVQPLIIGGEDAGPREFPHMARIGYGERPRISWLCGGSLISERFILSAAHCTKPRDKVASWANLGDLDVSTDSDEAAPVTIRIIERINHPGYKGKALYHDIALYKLERDAPLGIYIKPICLNTKINVPQPKAVASGWGHTVWGGSGGGSKKLQKVELDFVSNHRCNESYLSNIGQGQELPRGIIPDYMICAGGVEGKDTCQGDSGGPLQIALETPYCMYSIVGVTSFGKGCGTNTPGVYTHVAHYVPWIEKIVWPE